MGRFQAPGDAGRGSLQEDPGWLEGDAWRGKAFAGSHKSELWKLASCGWKAQNPSSREGVGKGHSRQERCLLLGWVREGRTVNSSAGTALGQTACRYSKFGR